MKLVFSFVLMLLCKSSFSQIDIISESVNHPDSNVLFVGVENHLSLKGTSAYNCVLKADSVDISKFDGKFIARVYGRVNTVLRLYRNKKLVLSKTFRIQTIPLPKAQLGNITDTSATISRILANPFLHVVYPNSAYIHDYIVFDYELDIIASENDILSKSGHIKGNFISGMQSKIIKDLHSNDKLLFHQIRVTCPGCRMFKLADVTIRIK